MRNFQGIIFIWTQTHRVIFIFALFTYNIWVKGTPMQIRKFHNKVRIHRKTIPWKFHVLNPKNSGIIYPWICVFLKCSLIFKIFYCFRMFVNKLFINRGVYISKSKRCYNATISAYYFYVRTKTKIFISALVYP